MMFSCNLREFNWFPDPTKIRMLGSAVPVAMLFFHYCFKPDHDVELVSRSDQENPRFAENLQLGTSVAPTWKVNKLDTG